MKKAIMIAAALMMFAFTAKAQVFIIDDDEFANMRDGSATMDIPNPQIYNSGEDWFVPAGEGIFVLAGLAGAYLLGKRRKEEK